jgi:hypothetical protein
MSTTALAKLAELEIKKEAALRTIEQEEKAIKAAALAELKEQRRELLRNLDSNSKEIEKLSGRRPPTPGSTVSPESIRPSGGTWGEKALNILDASYPTPMSPSQIAMALEAKGEIPRGSTKLNVLVSQAIQNDITSDDPRFAKIGRGRYVPASKYNSTRA